VLKPKKENKAGLSDFMHPNPTNRRVKVSGTLEIGEDGFLELCIFDEKGKQAIHCHRHPGKSPSWDFWLYPSEKKRKHYGMKED
jgi:hypothetical protein